jgi:hypothetical protein
VNSGEGNMERALMLDRGNDSNVIHTEQLDSIPVEANTSATSRLVDRGGRCNRAYGPDGQYSSEVQQRPHCLSRSASSRCVRTSVNKATSGYCAEFGTKRSRRAACPQRAPRLKHAGDWPSLVLG